MNRFTSSLLLAAICIPAAAHDAADPETRKAVNEAVEAYYQKRPLNRPTEAWIAANPPHACSKPRYPRAGLRDELEGTTVLSFQIEASGKAKNARLVRSSGWAVLDEAALEALAVCEFDAKSATGAESVSYRFSLE